MCSWQKCVMITGVCVVGRNLSYCWQEYVLSADVCGLGKRVCMFWKNRVLLVECYWLKFVDVVRSECFC